MEVNGVRIEYLGHSGFMIECLEGKRLFIDPYGLSPIVQEKKADMILITHGHYDHCSIKDIEKLLKKGTTLIIPTDAQSKVSRFSEVNMQIMEVGDQIEFGKIKIEALPAYNIGKEFHTKKDGFLGYLIKIGNVVVYHAGDTDNIPEMEKLTGYGKKGNEFIALLPVSGKYVMNSFEAAEAAEMLKASTAIPMHYGSGVIGTIDDANEFVRLCKEKGIHAEVLEKI